MTNKPISAILSFCLLSLVAKAEDGSGLQLVDVRRIWDKAPHNAFTDLIRFKNRWYCVFREGKGHVSPDGALRVITSMDGDQWESAALITSKDSDLRDAKITVTADGRLMLAGAEAINNPVTHKHQSLVWFSENGRKWSKRHEIGDRDNWLWRITWQEGKAYGFGYGCRNDNRGIRLFCSTDGKSFDTLIDKASVEGTYPNETSMVFAPDATCYCLLRQDGEPNSGYLGTARPPYAEWSWKKLNMRIGGPHMIRLPDGRFLAAVRLYDAPVRTSLCWLDAEKGKLTEALRLPSGGDTSYAGLVWHDNLLWISYYASHEGKTSIYLAKVKVETKTTGHPFSMKLWNGRAPIGEGRFEKSDATITVHRPSKGGGTAIVICPGGGYGTLVTGPEGHGIAEWLNRHGVTGIVLEYRLPTGRPFVPLLDAQRAIRTVRANAQKWRINPSRVGIMGFSAGGHLAATAGTYFDDGAVNATDPIDRKGCRPDFVMLVYPVVTMGAGTHPGSRRNLLGPNPSPDLIELFSTETQVTVETPPMFLAHALDDEPVPAENSKRLFAALQAAGVPSHYLELPSGGHGLNGYKGPMWEEWQGQALDWLAALKIPANHDRVSTEGSLDYTVRLETVTSGWDGRKCWVHSRAGAIPARSPGNSSQTPIVVMTTQKLRISGSDVFDGLHEFRTDNLGADWIGPISHKPLDRRPMAKDVEAAPCDFTPQWHEKTGKLLGTGKTFWYRNDEHFRGPPSDAVYSVYDPGKRTWSAWARVDLPDLPQFENCSAGCAQRYDLPNGDILLPVYFRPTPIDVRARVTVVRCKFDGKALKYDSHGNELEIPDKDEDHRGFSEPSLTRFHDRFYLTLRADHRAYVATSDDGMTFGKPIRWRFDDGAELGSYNTQQHWVTHSDGLFLTYTRRGAGNDHIFRHRAPIFMAQVDPERLVVIKKTERVVIPETGTRMGNFGIVDVSPAESWVITTEWMQPHRPDLWKKYGTNNRIFSARIQWSKPNRLVP